MERINQIIGRTISTSQGDTAPKPLHQRVLEHKWRYDCTSEAHARFVSEADAFCSAVLNRESSRWLTALGPSGIGKTFLMKQIVQFLKRAAYDQIWKAQTTTGFQTPQIAHIIPADDLTDYRAPRDYAAYDLIYVEDIGATIGIDKGSGAVLRGRIAELLQLRSNKFTLLCANLDVGALADHFDGRIASRLGRDESVCIEFPPTTPDFQSIQR